MLISLMSTAIDIEIPANSETKGIRRAVLQNNGKVRQAGCADLQFSSADFFGGGTHVPDGGVVGIGVSVVEETGGGAKLPPIIPIGARRSRSTSSNW